MTWRKGDTKICLYTPKISPVVTVSYREKEGRKEEGRKGEKKKEIILVLNAGWQYGAHHPTL